jgi:serine/threonine protein kinase
MPILNKLFKGEREKESYRKVCEIYSNLELVSNTEMSNVFKGQDKKSRNCAIKIPQEKEFERLENGIKYEAVAVEKLSKHPNTLDFVTYHEFSALVTKWEDMPTLNKKIEEGKLSPDKVEKLMFKIASVIEYSHSKGIIHGDVKPRNIFYGEKPKLFDFGLSGMIANGIEPGFVCGTPRYIAPEAFSGDHNENIDYYGLVISLVEALIGKIVESKIEAQLSILPRELQNLIKRQELSLNFKKALIQLTNINPNERKKALSNYSNFIIN